MKIYLQILILSLLLLLSEFTYAQEKKLDIDLVIGASMPELYHCGIRFHYIPNARLDFNFGSDFNNNYNGTLDALTINHAYYFGKVNSTGYRKTFNKKLWSINLGVSFLVEQTNFEKSTASYLNLFFAREIPITKKLFFQPEFGASYFLFEHKVIEGDIVTVGHRTLISPKFGINLFLKI